MFRVGEVFYVVAWVAGGEGEGGDVFGDDAAGSDYGSFADCYSGEDDDIACYPYVVAHGYRTGTHYSAVTFLDVKRVDDCAEADVGSDEHIVADCDLGLVENGEVEIADEILSDADIETEIAVKGRIYYETVAHGSEESADNIPPLLHA